VTVSGLAKGIDTFAHKGALEAGRAKPGKTRPTVVASGLDKIYPPEKGIGNYESKSGSSGCLSRYTKT